MANLSVEKLASVIGSVPEILLSQMQEAGLNHKELSDDVTDSDKKTLLDFLKNQQKKLKPLIIQALLMQLQIGQQNLAMIQLSVLVV